ncbi:hypothetical protein GMJAKD_07660 [Candidatus Electrothrix aarhusensis]
MSNNDTSFPWAGLLDISAIIGISLALLYTAGWSYAYHYFQCFHLGLIGLGIEREYLLLYGFQVCKAHWCLVPLCLLAAFGLPLLFQRCWQQRPELRSRLRAVAQIGGPIGLLFLFIVFYQLGAWTGHDIFASEQRGDFPDYPRVQVWLKDKQDKRGEAWAKGCYRLLLRGKEQLYLFRPDGVSERLPTEIVPNSEVGAVRLLPLYQTTADCR